MAISKDRKTKIKQAITKWLEAGDAGVKVEDLRARFKDISEPTFFRWLKECRQGAGHRLPLKQVEEARQLATSEDVAASAKAVRSLMPVPVSPNSIRALPNILAVELVHECIAHSREVLAYCKSQDGRIKNYKGYLAASQHQRSCVDTLARVAERANDAQRISEILDAMIDEIRKESPETAQRILERIQRIMSASGL